jgi:hypothetical protein
MIDDGAAAYGEGVWFWHPTLVSSLRKVMFGSTGSGTTVNPKATVAKLIAGEITSYKP